jgi:ABC-2 type transport system ATP-binding protein
MSILVKNLTKKYGAQIAVNAISFTAKPGEIVGFLGPNGAGKSSTMKMITGYLQKDAGSIFICDEEVKDDNISTKKNIGYLPESNPVYAEMYVKEYLAFVANVHEIKDVKQAVTKVIDEVGLGKEAGKKIGQLSKGYKQRVGLAAAIIHNPQVLILDEPTTGLDPNQIIEIRSVIKNLGREKTVLLSSHIMQEVEALCDRVIIIHNGSIIANDDIDTLRQSASASVAVQVVFDKEVPVSNIAALQGAINVTQNGSVYNVETNDAAAFKKELMQFSIQQGLSINSLSQGTKNLEEVFRQLTDGAAKN